MNGLIGRRLGRYEVVSLLGAGGMGEVYRARDTELERDVALKVLPEAAAEDPDRLERFAREARAVARLSHPNILEIHDVGCDDGVHYAVAELLEGETLRERLRRGRLPVRKAVAIADAISRGLGAAHSQGVVHRDVKPENVLLTSDGRVKVLDFGIASLHEPEVLGAGPDASEVSTITAAGSLLGTIGYMAPEQVRGEAADPRSDVFALGCVLYEMLTGERSFHRATPAETLAAVLHDEPPPPTTLTPDIPAGIDRVVMRCLEKEPGERFQSAADVAFALRAAEGSRGHRPVARKRKLDRRIVASAILGAALVVAAGLTWRHIAFGPPQLPGQKHLVVLQFGCADDNPESHLFALGLGEALAADLTLLEEQENGDLWVLPESSPRTRAPGDLRELEVSSGVTVGVSGQVAVRTSEFQVTLCLLNAESGERVAETRIAGGLGNLPKLQSSPLTEIGKLLGTPLQEETRDQLALRSTNVRDALQGYLCGIGALAVEPPEIRIAIQRLELASDADPLFGRAFCALARAYQVQHKQDPDPSILKAGITAAERAVATGRAPGEAEAVLAALLVEDGRLGEAAVVLEQAMRARPKSGQAALQLGKIYLRLKRFNEAETALERAVYLRPSFWHGHHYLGMLHFQNGQYEAAANSWRSAEMLVPEQYLVLNNLGVALERLGRGEESRACFERSLDLEPQNNYLALSNLGSLEFDASRFDSAINLLQKAVGIRNDVYWLWGYLGHSCRWGGEAVRAREAFTRAVELAEIEIHKHPEDPLLLARLAGYLIELDQGERALSLLEKASSLACSEPKTIALIAETWEDTGTREKALDWVRRAFSAGVSQRRFENRPGLRDLIFDPRYRQLVEGRTTIEAKQPTRKEHG